MRVAKNEENGGGVRVSITPQANQESITMEAPTIAMTSRPPEHIRPRTALTVNEPVSVAINANEESLPVVSAPAYPAPAYPEISSATPTLPTPSYPSTTLPAPPFPSPTIGSDHVVRMKLGGNEIVDATADREIEMPVESNKSTTNRSMLDLSQVAPLKSTPASARTIVSNDRSHMPTVVSITEQLTMPNAIGSQSHGSSVVEGYGHERYSHASSGNTKPTAVIELECSNAINIPMPSNVTRVVTLDEDTCRVVASERSFSIMGSHVGRTQIHAWTADGGNKPQIIEVNVVQPFHKTVGKPQDINQVQQSIISMYPSARIEIRPTQDGGLNVRGTVESEETAKKVLELVRKMYLVPVVDNVKVVR
jgi:hypothetical protein